MGKSSETVTLSTTRVKKGVPDVALSQGIESYTMHSTDDCHSICDFKPL